MYNENDIQYFFKNSDEKQTRIFQYLLGNNNSDIIINILSEVLVKAKQDKIKIKKPSEFFSLLFKLDETELEKFLDKYKPCRRYFNPNINFSEEWFKNDHIQNKNQNKIEKIMDYLKPHITSITHGTKSRNKPNDIQTEIMDTSEGLSELKNLSLQRQSYDDAIIEDISVDEKQEYNNFEDHIFFKKNGKSIPKDTFPKPEIINTLKAQCLSFHESFSSDKNSFSDEQSETTKILEEEMKEEKVASGTAAFVSSDPINPKKKILDCVIFGDPPVIYHLTVNINGKKEIWDFDPLTENLTRQSNGEIIDKSKLKNIKIPSVAKYHSIKEEKSKTQVEKVEERKLQSADSITR